MKKINWKHNLITSLIALLPMVLGVVLLPKLPDSVAIHWGMNNEPNGWVNKYVAVFGLPSFMALLQMFVSITTDLQTQTGKPKYAKVALWIIPITSPVLFAITMYLALGNDLEVRLIPGFILGTILIVFGNYMPKIPQEQNGKLIAKTLPPHKYRKAMRRVGFLFLAFGIAIFVSLFLRAEVTAAVIVVGILSMLGLSTVSFVKR
jgi:uncharacterized membrane protein